MKSLNESADLSKFIAGLRGSYAFLYLYKQLSQVSDPGSKGPLVFTMGPSLDNNQLMSRVTKTIKVTVRPMKTPISLVIH